jgi:hypothetical protein
MPNIRKISGCLNGNLRTIEARNDKVSANRSGESWGTATPGTYHLGGAASAADADRCGEFHNRIGICMLKSNHPVEETAFQQADRPAEQGSNSMDHVLNLAQIKAELSHLNRLDEIRETNVASLKRLKEARDALLGIGSEAAGFRPRENSGAA